MIPDSADKYCESTRFHRRAGYIFQETARVGYSAWDEVNYHELTPSVLGRVSPMPARSFRHCRREVSVINELQLTAFVAVPDPRLREEHAVDLSIGVPTSTGFFCQIRLASQVTKGPATSFEGG